MGKGTISVLALFLAGCASSGSSERGERRTSVQPGPAQTMRLHVIDVGQGDAILVEFPCAAMLVDTGAERNDELDGVAALTTYLREFFERRHDLRKTLALLVITHPHLDHTSGIRALTEAGYTIQNVVTNGQTHGSGGPDQRWLLETWLPEHAATRSRTIALSDLPPTAGLHDAIVDPIACPGVDPRIQALWGRVPQNPGWPAEAYKTGNNHSVVLRIDFGRASILLTGDLQEQGLKSLLSRYEGTGLLDVDVYKVGHHGSHNATTKPFLHGMSPDLAVVSMGSPKRHLPDTAWAYGHPRKAVIEMLSAAVAKTRSPAATVPVALGVKRFESMRMVKAVYGTGWDGTVTVELRTDGTNRVMLRW
jgi:competence protein ComEC